MKPVLDLARTGQSPCPEVEEWVERKLETVESQIRSLRVLKRRLRYILKSCNKGHTSKDRTKELCSLIVGLPEAEKFKGTTDARNAQTSSAPACSRCDSSC